MNHRLIISFSHHTHAAPPTAHRLTYAPGKVHGSLSRAGKVKSQTPKVEKTDKKKKPRGRANKRLLYNRRFVNVIVGPGKKKSPNSNADKM